MENQVLLIAQRIKELRQIIGKTPEEMAQITNTELKDYLACEAGESDFSFTFLHKCAKAFNVDITELLTGENPKLSGYSVVKSGEGLPLERRKGFKYNHLASFFKNKLAEPFLVKALFDEAALALPVPLAKHEGEEFDYVLKGELRVSINGHIENLKAGDAIYYDSSTPHGMIAQGEGDCEFLAIVMDAQGNANFYDEHKATVVLENTVTPEIKPVRKLVYEDYVKCTENEQGQLTDIAFTAPDNFNFGYDVVDKIARKSPDKLAALYVANDLTDRKFTFGDISRYSNMAANYFMSLGVKRGDRVVLVLKRHYEFWISIIALHKIGAIVIPATNLLVDHDFEYRFQAAGVSAIICTSDGDVANQVDLAAAKCPELKTKIITHKSRDGWYDFDKAYDFSDTLERVQTSKDDIMLMYFTSGTTGYPKIAAHSFTYALGHLITAKYWHNVDPDGLHLTISDTGWGKSVWGKLYGQWLCEAAVFIYDFDKFDAQKILPMFKKYNITTFCAPPTMYRFFIKDDLSKYDLSTLKYATIAGEALNPEVYQQFYNATGLKLMEGFGQTETTLAIANFVGTQPKPGSMGKPSPLFDIDLITTDNNSAKVGEVGEIVVKTDKKIPYGLFKGYYRNDEKTKEAWHDGMYHTGDMAWRDEDGYFWYVGRTDDLIKSSGYRIGPFEIESVIMELPYVLECAITGAPDPIRGQVVKATVVLTKGTVASDDLKKELQEYVKKHTAPYKYPRIVEFVEELPKTISGKIKRVDLRNQGK